MRLDRADALNDIANSADVREMMFLGCVYNPDNLDFADHVDDDRNIAMVIGGFGAIFVFRGPGIYECHIMARKASRGGFAMEAGREMLARMKELGAHTVWGQPSVYNRAAICYIRRMGLKPSGFGVDPVAGEVQYFVMEL